MSDMAIFRQSTTLNSTPRLQTRYLERVSRICDSRNLWLGAVGLNTRMQETRSPNWERRTTLATVIRPKRILVLIKAIVALCVGVIAGWLMQSWSFFQSSSLGRMSTGTGLPIIALAVWGGTVLLVGTVAWDHWEFRIEIHQEHLLLCDHLGTTIVRYDNIAETKQLPSFGAGIALKDRAKWLGSFEGKQSGFDKLCRITGFLKGTYGCDICITKSRLDIGAQKFLALLNERTGKAVAAKAGS